MSNNLKNILVIIISSVAVIAIPRLVRHVIVTDSHLYGFLLYNFIGPTLVAISILCYVKHIEKRDFRSIGYVKFKASRDIKWGLIGFLLGGMSFAITGPLVEYFDLSSTAEGVQKMADYFPLWRRVGIAFVAGITEEIIFRTFPIERLKEWTGSIGIAAVLSILLFAGLHMPFWELGGAIQIGVGTIIWTLIYIKTRSLWTMIIMHVINDLFAFVMLPMIFS